MQEQYRDKYRALGLHVAMYRKMRGYTQEQFAEKIGNWKCPFLSCLKKYEIGMVMAPTEERLAAPECAEGELPLYKEKPPWGDSS